MDNIAFNYQRKLRGDYILNENLGNVHGYGVFQSKLNADQYLYRVRNIGWLFKTQPYNANMTTFNTGLFTRIVMNNVPIIAHKAGDSGRKIMVLMVHGSLTKE